MARDIVSNATVNLTVNGGNSAKKLEELRARAGAIKKEITEIQNGGVKDSPRIRALRKEFEQVQKTINKCQTEMGRVTDVLARLDKASPKELRQTLNSLKRGLDSIERGSTAWESQVAMIKRVEAEMRRVNATLATAESRWTRMNRWLNDCQTSIMGMAAAVTGLALAGKKAVNKFAEMDQEMANVRKFTGMSEAQVKSLNEEFKKIDTRSGRDELNKLAQEAGRLGKQSMEDVIGFSRAADKINVSLDDLGDDATLTLSKLTGIFGDEQRLGTEKALLSVGSVINELSQNCSASAPYIAQFTSRMGGVASQAGMTVQQVMALAAVLDTTNQGVEAASTAVSQVITRLYQDTAKYAKVAGLDVKEFSDLLKKDANAAFIRFLETLNKVGGMDVLSPMFKDMGETGARAIAALSSLANHIDEVKSQQEVANQAFLEATSIDKEFEVQNNTVLAQMEKSRKGVSELAIQLGEKLQPVMKHVYSSSSIFLRVLNYIVSFLTDHAGAIASLTAAIIAYTVAAKLATIGTKAMAAAQVMAAGAAKAWKTAALLCNVALQLMTGNLSKAQAAWRLLNMTLKANPIGLLVSVITAAAVAIYNLVSKTDEFSKAMKDAMKSATSFADETRKEVKEIDRLFGALEGAKKGTKEYNEAKKGIISRYGIYLKGLIDEKGEIINLALAYERLTFAARKSAQARAINSAKEKIDSTYFQEIDNLTEKLRDALEQLGMADRDVARLVASVSQSIGSGLKVSDKDFSEIARFQGKNAGFFKQMFKETPVEILEGINSRQNEYLERSGKLEAMNARPLSKMDTKEVDSLIDYLSERLSTPSGENIEVKLSAFDKGTADKISEIIARDVPGKDVPVLHFLGGVPLKDAGKAAGVISREVAENLLRELMFEKSERPKATSPDSKDFGQVPETRDYVSDKDKAKADKKAAAEARRELLMKKQEFRDGLAAIEAAYRNKEALVISKYASGESDYLSYLSGRNDAEQKFCDDSRAFYEKYFAGIKDIYLEDDKAYQSFLGRKAEADKKYQEKKAAFNVDRIKKEEAFDISQLRQDAKVSPDNSFQSEIDLQKKIADIRLQSLRKQQKEYAIGSEQWEKLQLQIVQQEKDAESDLERQFQQKVIEMRKEYAELSAADRYRLEMQTLQLILDQGKIKLEDFGKLREAIQGKYKSGLPGGNYERTGQERLDERQKKRAEQNAEIDNAVSSGMISEEEGDRRKGQLDKEIWKEYVENIKNGGNEWVAMIATVADAWKDLWESLDSDSTNVLGKISAATQSTFAVVSAAMQMASQFAQANAEIETNKIEKRYEREAELAQGNTYLTKKLEKEKQKKVAEIKNKASEESFKMQVIQATAQMITGAINAYTSTAAIPIVGPVLAPAAAAVALAAGAANIALLKKQQEASASQGYAAGGYTRHGSKYEVAGVVHAGEWVAPKEMLDNPVTAGVIARLDRVRASGDISALESMADFSRRNNPVGTITRQDASRVVATGAMVKAADVMADSIPQLRGSVSIPPSTDSGQQTMDSQTFRQLSDVVSRLAQRLDEPFVTVNTVTGDSGINKALDDYRRMMRNKNRKR